MSDSPQVTVPFGRSEILVVLAAIGSFLNATLGHDWGISKNSQAIAALGVVLLPIGLGAFRATKHKAAMGANAAVRIASLQAGAAPAVPTALHQFLSAPDSPAPAPAVSLAVPDVAAVADVPAAPAAAPDAPAATPAAAAPPAVAVPAPALTIPTL